MSPESGGSIPEDECKSETEMEGTTVVTSSFLRAVAPLPVGSMVRGMGLAVDGISLLHGAEDGAAMSTFKAAGRPLLLRGREDLVVDLTGGSAASRVGDQSIGYGLT
jgi:hypothetical protein